jgi:hypothetical protein
MITKKLKGVEHHVFKDVSEYEQYFLAEDGVVPELIPWRDARFGDWVVADDGGVVRILYQSDISHHGDKKNYKTHKGYVRTIVGTFFQNDKVFMDTDFSKHPNRYRFGASTDKEYLHRRRTRKELSNPEVIFTAQLVAGKSLQAAYEEAFGSTHDWRDRALFLLKRERIMSKIKENAKDKLNEKFDGDVLDFIFEQLKDIAINAVNENTRLAAIKELGEWSGEKEKDKIKQVTKGEITVFQPFGQDELAKIEAEEVKVLAESDAE